MAFADYVNAAPEGGTASKMSRRTYAGLKCPPFIMQATFGGDDRAPEFEAGEIACLFAQAVALIRPWPCAQMALGATAVASAAHD